MTKLGGSLLALVVAAPAAAHHGLTGLTVAGAATRVTVRGVITNVDWQNPHVSVAIDVRRTDGRMELWIVALSQRMNSAEFTLADGRTFTTGNENWKRAEPVR